MAEVVRNYEYEPLGGSSYIRVLRLGSYDQETLTFDCTLQIIDIKDFSHPPYYALSYTWQLPDYDGEEDPPRPSPVHIRCDNRILEIGENLFDCLYQLEHLPKEEDDSDVDLIWIDAICINQANLAERSSQVDMMQEIYSKAAGAVIWLGREDKVSLHAIPLIQKLSAAAESHLPDDDGVSFDMMMLPGPLQDEEFISSAGITPLSMSDWKAISSLFSRSWFHRLWPVQELVMGKEKKEKNSLRGQALIHRRYWRIVYLAIVKGWINTLRTLEFSRSQNLKAATSLGIEVSLAMGAVYKAVRDGPMSGMLRHIFNYSDDESFLVAKVAWMLNICRQKRQQMNATEYLHLVA